MSSARASRLVVAAVLVAGCGGAPPPQGDVLEARLDVREAPHADVRVALVRVAPGDDLRDVLERAGVEPNGDAMALLYALNLGLVEKGRKKALTLRVPNAGGDTKHLVALTLYASRKEELAKRAQRVSEAVAAVKRLPKARFATEDVRAKLERALSEIDGLYTSLVRVIRSGKHALSPAFVDQLVSEAGALDRRVAGLVDGGKVIQSRDLDPIAVVLADSLLQAECCDETMGNPSAPAPSDMIVSVHVSRANGEVANLRVIAVPAFLQDDPSQEREFRLLSSPSEERLPPASWVIWAVEPGTKERVTDAPTVRVRRGDDPIVITLAYLKE